MRPYDDRVEKTVVLKNEDEVIEQLAAILLDNAKSLPGYEEDVYLYIDENGIGTLDTFTNVGGNSWLDDDHYTVVRMPQHYDDAIDTFQDEQELADAIGMTPDILVTMVAEAGECDPEDVDYYMVRDYVEQNYYNEIQKAYEELLEDTYDPYEEAREIWYEFINDGFCDIVVE